MPDKIEVRVTRVNEDGTRKELMFSNFEGVLLLGKFTDNEGDNSTAELVSGLSMKDIAAMIASSTYALAAAKRLQKLKSLQDNLNRIFDAL